MTGKLILNEVNNKWMATREVAN